MLIDERDSSVRRSTRQSLQMRRQRFREALGVPAEDLDVLAPERPAGAGGSSLSLDHLLKRRDRSIPGGRGLSRGPALDFELWRTGRDGTAKRIAGSPSRSTRSSRCRWPASSSCSSAHRSACGSPRRTGSGLRLDRLLPLLLPVPGGRRRTREPAPARPWLAMWLANIVLGASAILGPSRPASCAPWPRVAPTLPRSTFARPEPARVTGEDPRSLPAARVHGYLCSGSRASS